MSLNPEQVVANNNTPIAIINLSGNSTTVSPGIPITFDGTQSYDPDNTNIITYNWWYVDGVVQSQGSTADKKIFNYTFTLPAGVNSKTYQIKLTVRDNEYITASKTLTITITRSGRTEYYLTDHLGSIRTTIDQNGTVIGFDDYDPFGNVLPGRSYNAGTPNDLNKFTGVERDTEGNLNLDAFGRRLYDSELGRFYGVDRFYFKYQDISPFQYAGNSPLNFIDILGDSLKKVTFWGLTSSDPNLKERDYFVDIKIADDLVAFVNEARSTFSKLSVNNVFRKEGSSFISTKNTKAKGISKHQTGFAIDFNGVKLLNSDQLKELNKIAIKHGFKPLINQSSDLPHFFIDPTEKGYLSLEDAFNENQTHYVELTVDKSESVNNLLNIALDILSASQDNTRTVIKINQ